MLLPLMGTIHAWFVLERGTVLGYSFHVNTQIAVRNAPKPLHKWEIPVLHAKLQLWIRSKFSSAKPSLS